VYKPSWKKHNTRKPSWKNYKVARHWASAASIENMGACPTQFEERLQNKEFNNV
jgi:hypothetical protein